MLSKFQRSHAYIGLFSLVAALSLSAPCFATELPVTPAAEPITTPPAVVVETPKVIKTVQLGSSRSVIKGNGSSYAQIDAIVTSGNQVGGRTQLIVSSNRSEDKFFFTQGDFSTREFNGNTPTRVYTTGNGSASFTMSSTGDGVSHITVRIVDESNPANNQQSSLDISVEKESIPGAFSPRTCMVGWNATEIASDGVSSCRFTVQIRSASGEPVRTSTPIYITSSRLNDMITKGEGSTNFTPASGSTPASSTTDIAGIASFELRSKVAGTSIVSFGLKPDLISNPQSDGFIQSYSLKVTPLAEMPKPVVTPVIPSGPANPYTSVATLDRQTISNDGKSSAKIKIFLYDQQYVEVKTPTPVYFTSSQSSDKFYTLSSSGEIQSEITGKPLSATTDAKGTLNIAMTSTTPGESQLQIGLSPSMSKDTVLFNKKITVNADFAPPIEVKPIETPIETSIENNPTNDSTTAEKTTVDSYTSYAYSNATKIKSNGKNAVNYTVYLYDSYGNPVKNQSQVMVTLSRASTDKIKVLTGSLGKDPVPNDANFYVKSDANGKIVFNVTSKKVGTSQISIKVPNADNGTNLIKQFTLKVVK